MQPTPNDEVWAVGDAFDRAGPKCAFEVYKIFMRYGIKYLYGNHDGELKGKVTRKEDIQKPWYRDWWDSFDEEAKDWFLAAEKYYQFYDKSVFGKNVLLVHAGVDPEKSWHYHDPRTLCTIQCINPLDNNDLRQRYCKIKKSWSNRANYWPNFFKEDGLYHDMHIVFGHTPHMPDEQTVYYCKNDVVCYAVDSGCCRNGYLSAYILDSEVGSPSVCVIKSEKDYYYESYKQK